MEYTVHKVSKFGFPNEVTYVCFRGGTRYRLNVLEYVDAGEYGKLVFPKMNGMAPFIFKAKCWWAEGANWWIGARHNAELREWGDPVGPFTDVDQALVYLQLTKDDQE